MNAAQKQGMSLAEQLRISSDEKEAVAQRLNFMLRVAKNEFLTLEEIDKIYGEWEILANRLKKGRSMLDSEIEGKRLSDVTNLYTFLLAQLALYDRFFQKTLPKPDYRHLQKNIVDIMNG